MNVWNEWMLTPFIQRTGNAFGFTTTGPISEISKDQTNAHVIRLRRTIVDWLPHKPRSQCMIEFISLQLAGMTEALLNMIKFKSYLFHKRDRVYKHISWRLWNELTTLQWRQDNRGKVT